jgi:hypothetical protein
MSDQIPPNSPDSPPQGSPPMGGPVNKNLSMLNPVDAVLMKASGQITPQTTVKEFLESKGIDLNGPVVQLTKLADQQVENANPINKMRNIAADTALQKGGQPPTMPGVKPMVAPPGQPAPSGMNGLLNKLGG